MNGLLLTKEFGVLNSLSSTGRFQIHVKYMQVEFLVQEKRSGYIVYLKPRIFVTRHHVFRCLMVSYKSKYNTLATYFNTEL